MADDPHQPEPTTPQPATPDPEAQQAPGSGSVTPEPASPGPDDATAVHRPDGPESPRPGAGGDETSLLPPAGTGDTTVFRPTGPAETAMIPSATGQPGGQGARWSARAGVPATDHADEEWVPPQEPGGAWWLPIALGIGGLILVALVGLGVWLAVRHSGNTPAPVTSPSVSPTPSPTPSPSPTASPTPPPSPTAAAVTLPELRGTSLGDAQTVLTGLGLVPAVRNQVDGSVPPGFVIGTDPPANSTVPAGGTVTLIVAVAPSPSPTPSDPPSPTVKASPSPSKR